MFIGLDRSTRLLRRKGCVIKSSGPGPNPKSGTRFIIQAPLCELELYLPAAFVAENLDQLSQGKHLTLVEEYIHQDQRWVVVGFETPR